MGGNSELGREQVGQLEVDALALRGAEPDADVMRRSASDEEPMSWALQASDAARVLWAHHERLNVDRLVRIVCAQEEPRVQAFWASVARWLRSDRRLKRLGR
jgi:hypothetical protein